MGTDVRPLGRTVIRALACDLDGTLVSSTGEIATADVQALTAAARHGVRRVLITGRPSRCLDDVGHVLALFDCAYASNGAELVGPDGRVSQRHPLPREQARDLVERIRKRLPGACFAVEYGSAFGYEPEYSYWPATDNDPRSQVGDVHELLAADRPALKLLVKAADRTCEYLADLVGTLATGFAVTHSNPAGVPGPVEVTAAEATKGRAVSEFAAANSIGLHEFAAFGDRPNDLSMLELVGYPVVVRGGGEVALARFQQAGTGDGDGVGAWLASIWPHAFTPAAETTVAQA